MRQLSQANLHALAYSLRRHDQAQGLSARQEWLWAALMSELEYRWRHAGPLLRCRCEFCRQSPELDWDPADEPF